MKGHKSVGGTVRPWMWRGQELSTRKTKSKGGSMEPESEGPEVTGLPRLPEAARAGGLGGCSEVLA